jgi:hypothetical protein
MKAIATSWKREPFTEGLPLSFRAEFSDEELRRMEAGLIPKEMEDKWFVCYEAPHLFFHRSWTGQPVYRVALKSTSGGAMVAEALWAKPLASAENADSGYQSKLLDFLVSNLLLGQSKPFPRPEGLKEPMPGVFQHHATGTGYREVSVKAKKPWWRLW